MFVRGRSFSSYLQPVPDEDGEIKYKFRAPTVGVVVKVVEGEEGEEPMVTVMTNYNPPDGTGPRLGAPRIKSRIRCGEDRRSVQKS